MENENTEIKESSSSLDAPATAQEVREVKLLTSVKEANKVLASYSLDYSTPDFFPRFETLAKTKIDNNETKDLKQLGDAKNILHRKDLQDQVKEYGKFELNIPFEKVCPTCGGGGERYKFFKKVIEVNCKYCDNGEVIITCPKCRGSGNDGKCTKCNKIDEKTGKALIGKIKVKCRMCRTCPGKFQKLVIDSYIKSTTYCRDCKGLGFCYKKPKQVDNPAIPSNIGQEIKKAVASE